MVDITTLLSEGFSLTTITYALIISILGSIVVAWANKLIEHWFEKKSVPGVEKVTNLSKLAALHPFFNEVKYYRDIRVVNCKLGGPVRTKVFRDCLKIYFDVYINEIEHLMTQEITQDNFLALNYAACDNRILKTREALMLHGIPQIVIEKFEEWSLGGYEHMKLMLSDLDSSGIIDSIIEKQYMALHLYRENAYFAIVDAEKTLSHLNGQLTGTKYQGEEIEPLH